MVVLCSGDCWSLRQEASACIPHRTRQGRSACSAVVMVHSAGIQDCDGAKPVLRALGTRFPGLQLIWADGGYVGKFVTWVATVLQRLLVIVKRPRHTRGFQVVQWRWIVERTFG